MMGRWVLLEQKHHVCLGGRGTLQQAGGILARKVSVTHLLSQQEGTPAHLPGQRGGGTYLVHYVHHGAWSQSSVLEMLEASLQWGLGATGHLTGWTDVKQESGGRPVGWDLPLSRSRLVPKERKCADVA